MIESKASNHTSSKISAASHVMASEELMDSLWDISLWYRNIAIENC